jgi:branched-chain amino acid aminotransferase
MPTTIGILTKNGLIDAAYRAESLTEAVQYEPEGVYTVASTFRRHYALLLDSHLDRMEESARLENISLHVDRIALRLALRTLIDRSGYENSRFRITVPRQNPDQFIISLEPFAGVPVEVKSVGVKVATVKIARRNPKSKTSEWMTKRSDAKMSMPLDAYEGIIVNDADELLEGFGSNFYALWNGKLYTADDNTVLGGISRKIVFSIAPDIVPIEQFPIHVQDISAIDEAFLTSSSRGIIPIIKINAEQISDGGVGTITYQLMQRYDTWVDDHIELI